MIKGPSTTKKTVFRMKILYLQKVSIMIDKNNFKRDYIERPIYTDRMGKSYIMYLYK